MMKRIFFVLLAIFTFATAQALETAGQKPSPETGKRDAEAIAALEETRNFDSVVKNKGAKLEIMYEGRGNIGKKIFSRYRVYESLDGYEVTWNRFLVDNKGKVAYVLDIVEGQYVTLQRWRSLPTYP